MINGASSNSPIRLDGNWRPAVLGHLLALDADDRYGRFATTLSDDGIAAYVGRLDFALDLCFGTLETEGSLSGFIHLAVQCPVAELGASVAADRRGQGRAYRLFQAALSYARRQGIHEIHLATGHPVARRICQGLGYLVESNPGYPRAKVFLGQDRMALTADVAADLPALADSRLSIAQAIAL